MITDNEMKNIRKITREWYDCVARPRIATEQPLEYRDFMALNEMLTKKNIENSA